MNPNAIVIAIKNLRDRTTKRSIFCKNNKAVTSIDYDNNIIIMAEITSINNNIPAIYITAYDRLTNAKSVNDAVCIGSMDTCYEITDEIIEQEVFNFCRIIENGKLTWNASLEDRDAEWNRWFTALYA